ncbi:LAMI_0D01112g1_1 [Lachancea mirantina]|uniref:LAMI_0D01112g1_1 n=1 Tax=Lachancea mirantina TaxID=1230905 RepID=A0A1G4J8Q6_9SACH|nr:LAMI_0D01112g1_1 [Lachancea mirantina]
MAPFRQESYFVVYPGSQRTLVQFGIREETFHLPQLEIPTEVYQKDGKFFSKNYDGDCQVVKPIKDGKIQDLNALLFFLKLIYRSILAEKSGGGARSDVFETELANIPMLLISSVHWTQSQLERITQFVFEQLQINNFMFLPSPLATSYALGSLQNCIVIDIHASGTEVVPIMDYVQLTHLMTNINVGGNSINEDLAKLLPQWDADRIEDLKRSPIFEVLSEDAKQSSAFDFQEGVDEGALDVAALVTSDRDTRELLEERERKKAQDQVGNAQRETNTFTDRSGQQVVIGKQRFQGCDVLIGKISTAVGLAASQIDDFHKLRAMWENVMIVGGTSSIPGFKEALLHRLCVDHLVQEPQEEKQKREQELMSQAANKRKTKFSSSFVNAIDYVQIPSVIKIAKYPEYFPEWKRHGFSEVPFLGAQIVTKQVFGHSNESFYVTRDKYEKKGPSAIWDVTF